MQPLTLNRYAYAVNNPMMYTDPSGHWPGWLDNAVSKVKDFVSDVVDTVVDYGSKALSYVTNAVSNAYDYVSDKVSSWYSSAEETVDNFVSYAEEKIDEAKEVVSNTIERVEQLAEPIISTINYPNEVVRTVMETVKKGCEGAQYVLSKAYEYKDQILDGVQLALDIAGFVPVVGDVLDGVNGLISLARGNTVDAALSFASMIPLVGDAAKVGKYAVKAEKAFEVVNAADKAIDLVRDGRNAVDVTKALEKGLSKADFISAPGGIIVKAEDYITDASRMLPNGDKGGCFVAGTRIITEQ